MNAFLVVVGILMLAGTAGADYKECRQGDRDKNRGQTVEAGHAGGPGAVKGRALGSSV